MDPMSYTFPSDLLEASSTCKALEEQIAAFPLRVVVREDGTPYEFERRREAAVYTDEMERELAKLRADRLENATAVVTHEFWGEVPADEQWKARSALRHAGES